MTVLYKIHHLYIFIYNVTFKTEKYVYVYRPIIDPNLPLMVWFKGSVTVRDVGMFMRLFEKSYKV